MAKEHWRRIRDLDYEISTQGRVRRLGRTDRVLKLQGYLRVGLYDADGEQKQILVHQLVAEAFLGPRPTPGHTPNHKNGDHGDNSVENLEWLSREEQQHHAIDEGLYGGRGEEHGRAKLTEKQVQEIRSRYTGAWGQQTAMAREYGVSQALIAKIVRGEVWTHLADCPASAPTVIRGSTAVGAKLTYERACEIRRRVEDGESRAMLATEYGVSRQTIYGIVAGRTWRGPHAMGQGSAHGRAKLTEEQVREMRAIYSTGAGTYKELAELYGLKRQIIRDIIRRKTWKHVE
jgi:DNA invertase Pin-like site-specific DNA recombinase